MRKHKIVEVEWLDASHHSGWKDIIKAKKLKLLPCKTVGYLVGKSGEAVIVAETHDSHYMSGFEVIPRSCVTSIKER